jgi:hypothetical protein
LRDRQLNLRLSPQLEKVLVSAQATLIEWYAWPGRSGYANLLAYAVGRGLVPEAHASAVAEGLATQYRLVKWARPLPGPFGGGRFLVRRDVELDNRVVVLDNQLAVRRWRDREPVGTG